MRTGATVSSTAQQRSLSLLRPSSRALTVEPSSGEMMHVDPYEHLAICSDGWGISHVAGGFYTPSIGTRQHSAFRLNLCYGTMDLLSPQIHAQRVRQALRPSNPFAPDTEQGQPQE